MFPHLALISLCHFVFADSAAKMGVGCVQIPAEASCELLPLKELSSSFWCCCVGNISIKQEVIVPSVWMETKTLWDDIGFQTCSYLWYGFGIHINYLNHVIFCLSLLIFREQSCWWTYDVHEGQEIFLNMFSAVEEMNWIVHSQQNLAEGMRG